MSRAMTAAMQAEVAKSAVRMCYLVELRFDSGTEYHTTAHKIISWGGNNYLTGNLVDVRGVRESLPLEERGVTITLAGANQANLQKALTENYIDRTVVIYRAMLDANDALIADPLLEWMGSIDKPAFREDPAGGATLEWSAGSQLQRFDKVAGRRTSNEDQQVHFAGDVFFEFAAQVDEQIPWGRAS